jgi:hypothetical protein
MNSQETRRVRFSPGLEQQDYQEVPLHATRKKNSEEAREDESAPLWYSCSEFKTIKSMAHLIAKQSQFSSLSHLLDGTFGPGESASRDVEKQLTAWSRHAESRRGLESMVNRRMQQARRKHRSLVVQSVMVCQEQLRELECDYEEEADFIARASSRQTSASQQYASIMGRADARAAKRIKLKPDRKLSPRRRIVQRPRFVTEQNAFSNEFSLSESPRSVMHIRNL